MIEFQLLVDSGELDPKDSIQMLDFFIQRTQLTSDWNRELKATLLMAKEEIEWLRGEITMSPEDHQDAKREILEAVDWWA